MEKYPTVVAGCMQVRQLRKSVVHFKIFKKGGFDASGCHTGSRNMAQISKDVRELLGIILSRLRSSSTRSQVKRKSKAIILIIVTWICQMWLFSNMALELCRKRHKKQQKQEKKNRTWNSSFHGPLTTGKHTSTKSDWTHCWSPMWLDTAPRD